MDLDLDHHHSRGGGNAAVKPSPLSQHPGLAYTVRALSPIMLSKTTAMGEGPKMSTYLLPLAGRSNRIALQISLKPLGYSDINLVTRIKIKILD